MIVHPQHPEWLFVLQYQDEVVFQVTQRGMVPGSLVVSAGQSAERNRLYLIASFDGSVLSSSILSARRFPPAVLRPLPYRDRVEVV